MFALAIEYLMGWAMAATDGARKQRAEWPPHPDRVFMALAAAWFETGSDAAEGAALRWLEALPPPALVASSAALRTPVTHYVPVNDASQSSTRTIAAIVATVPFPAEKAKDAGLAQFPDQRGRQPRSFPVAIPHDPIVHLVWSTIDVPTEHRGPLDALSRKVTAVGHSASLVRMWVTAESPALCWVPGDGPEAIRMRITGAGRLSYLEGRMNKQEVLAHAAMLDALGRAKKSERTRAKAALDARFPDGLEPVSLRPEPGLWQSYVRPRANTWRVEPARTVFDERLIVLTLAGQRLSLETTLQLTTALRGTLLSTLAACAPEWLSGHEASGAPTRQPHLALLPLAFVGVPRADGRILGAALALPHSVPLADAGRVLGPFLRESDGSPRRIRIFAGGTIECTASLEIRERVPWTLDLRSWIGPARRWATVTPIVLDRHLEGSDRWDRAAEVVADACERVGLPRPVDVLLHPHALLEGVPPARRFPAMLRKKDGGRLAHSHALLTFDLDVIGPVTVGAGRFRGYGLCRPLRSEGGADEGL